MQSQELEKRVIIEKLDKIKIDITDVRSEFKKNDKILEKSLSDLIHDFK